MPCRGPLGPTQRPPRCLGALDAHALTSAPPGAARRTLNRTRFRNPTSTLRGKRLKEGLTAPNRRETPVSRPRGAASPNRLSPAAPAPGRPKAAGRGGPPQTPRQTGPSPAATDGSGFAGSHSPSSWKRLQGPDTRLFSASGPPTQAHNAPRRRSTQKLRARRRPGKRKGTGHFRHSMVSYNKSGWLEESEPPPPPGGEWGGALGPRVCDGGVTKLRSAFAP